MPNTYSDSRFANTWDYNPFFVSAPECYEGWDEASPLVKAIIKQMLSTNKIIASASVALDMARDIFAGPVTMEDVQCAYDIAAGGGCEYEWKAE